MAEGLREWAAEAGRNPNLSSGEVRENTSSSSSSSSNLSLSPASESGECGLDGMELDAARALACILLTAVPESSGKRRKRHKNGSPARDWEDTIKGRDLTFVHEDNRAIEVTREENIKFEQFSERPPASSNCSSNYLSASSGRKMWQNLTQAEKEARRMHRVLANRESARQTIRRRQAIRDDLTKKVSDLSLDNQKMKMEKEQVLKEYTLLKNKNKRLKDEMAMAIECNIMGAGMTSTSLERSSFPHEHPYLKNIKPPFMPGTLLPWPVIAAQVGMLYDDGDSHKATGPRTLMYVPPCSWFHSLLHQMHASCHLMSGTWRDKEANLPAGRSEATVSDHKSSVKEQGRTENSVTDEPSPSKAVEVKSYKLDIDLNHKSDMLDPLLDVLNQCSSLHDEPVSNVAVVNSVDKHASGTEVVRGFNEQPAVMDVSGAAVARRRRKEIIKLKHLCGRTIGIRN